MVSQLQNEIMKQKHFTGNGLEGTRFLLIRRLRNIKDQENHSFDFPLFATFATFICSFYNILIMIYEYKV